MYSLQHHGKNGRKLGMIYDFGMILRIIVTLIIINNQNKQFYAQICRIDNQMHLRVRPRTEYALPSAFFAYIILKRKQVHQVY